MGGGIVTILHNLQSTLSYSMAPPRLPNERARVPALPAGAGFDKEGRGV